MSDAGSITLSVSIESLVEAGEKAVRWIIARTVGARILIVGPSQAGKTAFFDYLSYSYLGPESDHVSTFNETRSPTISKPADPAGRLRLNVKGSWDQPGQWGPMAHASIIEERRPNAILVMLDATTPVPRTRSWPKEFCLHVDRVYSQAPSTKQELRSMVVCLNKRDKVKNEPTTTHDAAASTEPSQRGFPLCSATTSRRRYPFCRAYA